MININISQKQIDKMFEFGFDKKVVSCNYAAISNLPHYTSDSECTFDTFTYNCADVINIGFKII
jgi:hypothetical protein